MEPITGGTRLVDLGHLGSRGSFFDSNLFASFCRAVNTLGTASVLLLRPCLRHHERMRSLEIGQKLNLVPFSLCKSFYQAHKVILQTKLNSKMYLYVMLPKLNLSDKVNC